MLLQISFGTSVDLRARAGQRIAEAIAIEGLQKIIDRMDVERAERVAVERGHEDHERHAIGSDRVDHVEPRAARHLHVEEDQARAELLDRGDRGAAVGALLDDGDPGLIGEQHAQPLTSKRFVVGDHHSCLRELCVSHATRVAVSSLPDETR